MLIDEAWHLISRPETGAYANDLARRARHLGLVLIVMSQQLSDFDTEHGVALLGNSPQQLLLAQNPKKIPFIADNVQLSDREAAELARLKTVKGRHAQMLWLNGTRGHGKLAVRVGPTDYWAFTSDPAEQAIREAEIARHQGDVWAAIAQLARRGTRAHRHPNPARTARRWRERLRAHRPRSRHRAGPTAAADRHLRGRIAGHDARRRDRTHGKGSDTSRPAAGGVRSVRRGRREPTLAYLIALTELYRHGLIAQHPVGIREHTRSDGKPPLLYSITRRGLEVAQTREPPSISIDASGQRSNRGAGCDSPTTCTPSPGRSSFTASSGTSRPTNGAPPATPPAASPVPQTGSSRGRHRSRSNEIALPDKQAIIDEALNPFTEVQPNIAWIHRAVGGASAVFRPA